MHNIVNLNDDIATGQTTMQQFEKAEEGFRCLNSHFHITILDMET